MFMDRSDLVPCSGPPADLGLPRCLCLPWGAGIFSPGPVAFWRFNFPSVFTIQSWGSGLVYSDILVRLYLFESTFHIRSLSKRGMIWCEEYLMVPIKAGHGHQALGSIIHGELSLVFITSTQRVGIVTETLGGLRTRL